MSVIPVTAPMKENHQLGVSSRGWYRIDHNIKALKDGLAVENSSKQDEMMAVPHVWAQLIMCTEALTEQRHPQHGMVRAQWRGLMALLALSQYHSLDLRLVPVRLDREADYTSPAIGTNPPANFAAVIWGREPCPPMFRDQSWREISVLVLDGTPVGFVCPSILVCPARGVTIPKNEKTPWCNGEAVLDPTAVHNMLKEDLFLLKDYLDGVAEAMVALHDRSGVKGLADGSRYNLVQREVLEFHADARERLERIGALDQALPSLNHKILSMGQTNGVMQKLLGRIPNVREELEPDTCLMLPLRPEVRPLPERGGEEVNALLLADDLATQLATGEGDIPFWGKKSLAHFRRLNAREKTALLNKIKQDNWLVVDPADLFSDYLIDLEGVHFSGHPKDFENSLLPISPLALLFIGPGEIDRRLRIKGTLVTLELELSAPDLSSRSVYFATKDFSGRHVRIKRPNSQQTFGAIRPNISANYGGFMLALGYTAESPLRPSRGLGRNTMRKIMGPDRAAENIAKYMAWYQGKSDAPKDVDGEVGYEGFYGQVRWDLYGLEEPPEAVLFTYAENRQSGLAGLAIAPDPVRPVRLKGKITIGVDIGSDTTMIGISHGGKESKLDFGANVELLWRSELLEDRFTDTQEFLLLTYPNPCATPLPTATIVDKVNGNELSTWLNGDPRWLCLDTRLCNFASLMPILDVLFYKKEADFDLISDIKWRIDTGARKRLEEYCLLLFSNILQEVACRGGDPSQVEFRISYPQAMHDHHEYRGKIEKALRSLETAMSDSGNGGAIPVSFLTEAEAAAQFFMAQKQTYNATVITVDIGGVTSDVTIWQKRKLLWQGSMALGSRDLFIAYMFKNINFFLEIIGSRNPGLGSIFREALVNLDQAKLYDRPGLFDALVLTVNNHEFQSIFQNEWLDHSGREKNLPYFVNLAFAGLLRYLAMVINTLEEPGFDRNTSGVTIHLAGRGSLMIHNVCQRSLAENTFGKALKKWAGLGPDTEVEVRHAPETAKHEVALGLLIDPEVALDVSKDKFCNPLGEEVWLGDLADDRSLKAHQNFDADHLDLLWTPDENLTNLRRFVTDEFPRMFGNGREYSDEMHRQVLKLVQDDLLTEQSGIGSLDHDKAQALRTVQPIFIRGLRALLQLGIGGMK